MRIVRNVASGIAIGIAEVIPGISGGTIAVLLNIYDELIYAVSHLKENFKQNILFLLLVVLGSGISILAFSHVIKFLLLHYPMPVNFFFLGVVLGLVPMLSKRGTVGGFKIKYVVPFAITFLIMLGLAFIPSAQTEGASTIITEMDPGTFFRFLCVGCLAAICLILPGISGSMIMVIFGIYDSVIVAVSSLHIIMLIPVGLGILIGILFGAKLVDICLQKYSQLTYFAILGLVLGSTISIYNRAGFMLFSLEGLISLLTFVGGIALSIVFTSDKLQK